MTEHTALIERPQASKGKGKERSIKRLTPVQIERLAANVDKVRGHVHVMDQRAITLKRMEIRKLRCERSRRRRSRPNKARWYVARRYPFRGMVLWMKVRNRKILGYRLTNYRTTPLWGISASNHRLAMVRGLRRNRPVCTLSRYCRLDQHRLLYWHNIKVYGIRGSLRSTLRRRAAEVLRRNRARLLIARASQPNPRASTLLGWRKWRWDSNINCLISPLRLTVWTSEMLTADRWDDSYAVSGVCGVHAHRLPRKFQRHLSNLRISKKNVVGVVERFGRAVVGQEGWRAEQVVIRELFAPDQDMFIALQGAYPGATVYLTTGNQPVKRSAPCISEKL